VLPCAAGSCKRAGAAGSLGGDIAASYFSKANCQFLSNVFVRVAASTLAALTVFACQKDYFSEPRNHETRNGVPAMGEWVARMIG
jgi:hypothetical protein